MKRTAAIALLILLAQATAGLAGTTGTHPARISFSGCPERLVEATCIGVRSNGTLYNITGAKPAPRFDYLGIEGSGMRSSKITFCMQGILLDDVKWSYTRQSCSPGAR